MPSVVVKRRKPIKKEPRIKATQKQSVRQVVVVHVGDTKKRNVRRAAPRGIKREDIRKDLLTRPIINPTPAYDAAQLAQQLAAQEKALTRVLEQQALQQIAQKEANRIGYYGTDTLQQNPQAAPVQAPPAPPAPPKTPAPPTPIRKPKTDEERASETAVKKAMEELAQVKEQRKGAFGLTDEILRERIGKLKPSPSPSISGDEESVGETAAEARKRIDEEAEREMKEIKEVQKEGKRGRPKIPEGVLTRGQMDNIKDSVENQKALSFKALKGYAETMKIPLDKGMTGTKAGPKANRIAFAKKLYQQLAREGAYD